MKVNIASLKKIASNILSDNSPEVVDDKFICVYVGEQGDEWCERE